MGPFPTGGSLPLLRFVPIGPFTEPVGIRPHWPVASPVRVRRLQNRMFGSYCSAEARNTKDAAFKLHSEYNPSITWERRRREKEPAYAGPPWLFRGSSPTEDRKSLIS
jgi:hypothetical protein